MKRNRKGWFLGIDIGTGSCKTVVADENFTILGFSTAHYGGEDSRTKWLEQNLVDIFSATVKASIQAIEMANVEKRKCIAVSLGGALHTFLAIDGKGNPLIPAITWADTRAGTQAKRYRLSEEGLELYKRTGCPPHPMYPLYKLLWLKENELDIFRRADKFISVKEYVFSRLVGEYAVDYSLASGSSLFNVITLDWDELALELVGIPRSKLSNVCKPTEIFYFSNKEIADKIGIPHHTLLILGSSDAVNSSLGAGAFNPYQATCMVGTSGALRVLYDEPILDVKMRTWCYAIEPGKWLIGGAINNGGIILEWLKEILGINSTDYLLSLAENSNIGAKGLICLPFFAGERSPNWNFNAKASLVGLTLEHTREDIARSFVESIAFRLKSVQNALIELIPEVKEIRVSGGLTHSTLWIEILANVLGKEILVPQWKDTSAPGASLWAMKGANHFEKFTDIVSHIRTEKNLLPDPKKNQIYEQIFKLYEKLYARLSPIFDELHAYQFIS
ncbi:MAG: gluconokinase [Deltaproteobacteria bacterium]|nr:gluconokinase [Deltaproteobacteria bacterium]